MQKSIEHFVESGRITQEEVDMVNLKKIGTFLDSSVAARMAAARKAKGSLKNKIKNLFK